MPDVEILWPSALPSEVAHDAEAALEDVGLTSRTLVMPTRRHPGLTVILLMSTLLKPFAETLARHAAGDTHSALQVFVRRLLRKPASGDAAASGVVFRSTTSHAEFVFVPGLPVEAFRKAIELDPGEESGRWVWDAASRRWARFEVARSTS